MKHLILFESETTPLKLAGKSFDVFVLENNLRVISIKSIQKALGYDGKNENWIFEFLKGINNYLPISTEILDAYQNPLKIYNSQKQRAIVSNIFVETLHLIVKAKEEGFLNINQIKFSKEAQKILEDENLSTIKKSINDSTGFTLFNENIIEKITLNLQNNDLAFVWIKTFPNEFFELLMEMKNINWRNLHDHQLILGEIVYEIIFSRIDNPLLEELRKLKPKRTYKRKNSKYQDLEHPKLKQHLAVLISLIKVSGNNWNIFTQLLNKSFPEQKNQLAKKIKISESKKNKPLSPFDEKLVKSLLFKTK